MAGCSSMSSLRWTALEAEWSKVCLRTGTCTRFGMLLRLAPWLLPTNLLSMSALLSRMVILALTMWCVTGMPLAGLGVLVTPSLLRPTLRQISLFGPMCGAIPRTRLALWNRMKSRLNLVTGRFGRFGRLGPMTLEFGPTKESMMGTRALMPTPVRPPPSISIDGVDRIRMWSRVLRVPISVLVEAARNA